MAKGNVLEIAFDPVQAPRGVRIDAIRSYAGHGDARASQRYTVLASRTAAPDRFVRIADVRYDAAGGLTEVVLSRVDGKPLVGAARRLRFVFADGPAGFNVYREIGVFGAPVE